LVLVVTKFWNSKKLWFWLFESKNLQFHLIETFKKPIKKTSCASSSKTLKEPPVFTRESAKEPTVL
jgi:hypothetical protein